MIIIYIILDAPLEIWQKHILNRGDDITEKYHTLENLTYYRKKFNIVNFNIEIIKI